MSRAAPVSFALVRNTAAYYWRNRRYRALVRALWLTIVRRCGMELCQFCGGRYANRENDMKPFAWWAPTPLWTRLVDVNGHGLACPGCFNAFASRAGLRLMWTPLLWTDNDTILERVDAIYAEIAEGEGEA